VIRALVLGTVDRTAIVAAAIESRRQGVIGHRAAPASSILGMAIGQWSYPTRRRALVGPRRRVHENDACPLILLGARQIALYPPDGLVFGSGQANDLIYPPELREPHLYGGHPAEELGQSRAGVRKAIDVIGMERIGRAVRRRRIRRVLVDRGRSARRARANLELCVVVAYSRARACGQRAVRDRGACRQALRDTDRTVAPCGRRVARRPLMAELPDPRPTATAQRLPVRS
jgi:hypothetical protein